MHLFNPLLLLPLLPLLLASPAPRHSPANSAAGTYPSLSSPPLNPAAGFPAPTGGFGSGKDRKKEEAGGKSHSHSRKHHSHTRTEGARGAPTEMTRSAGF